ncbi:hypothetical protein KAR91_27290 [Candidatus Pacearchaeota archaeon]|nr:hypothetical protein [Candidatus Pacearchaeota archaeon]
MLGNETCIGAEAEDDTIPDSCAFLSEWRDQYGDWTSSVGKVGYNVSESEDGHRALGVFCLAEWQVAESSA